MDMYSKDARANGETGQRLYGRDTWRQAPYYATKERAALAWADAVTLVAQTHVPDEVFEKVTKEFTEAQIISLTYLVAAISAWNRLAISMRAVPGQYQPALGITSAAT